VATEARKFQVGVVVIAATALAVGTVIWLGASRFFEHNQQFVSYFSESVQGLDPGAAVKYRGVPSGHVAAIRIAEQDSELIEVLMDINVEAAKVIKKDPNLRTMIQLTGITGLRYIEIDRRAGAALRQSPTLTFTTPYEVLPSAQSSFKEIQAALADVYDVFMQMNLPAIAGEARSALEAANNLLRDDRIDALLSNFKSTSESTMGLARNLETMTSNVRLGPAVDNATQATAAAKDLFVNLTNGPTAKQFSDTLEQINRLAQGAQQVVLGLQYTVDRLDRTVDNLQSLTDTVRNQPSLLLFSAPPEQRRAVDGGKK
jgi:phospholipid/cholesterol/gamma-HCH transport system substrate-binding protein